MSGRPRKNLTTGEVALLCEVAPGTVGRWVDSGALAGFRLPGSRDRRVPVAAFREFLARHRMPADGLEEYLAKVERRRGTPSRAIHKDGGRGRMSEITLTSDITVRLIQSMGGDHMPVAAARASTSGVEALEYADPARAGSNAGLINYLVSQRHGTPSEHSSMTFFVHAPAFVWWEWIRHRVGQSITCPGLSDDTPDASFNLESGRYKVLDPVFWVPRRDRKMKPTPEHKPSRPKFEALYADWQYNDVVRQMEAAYSESWKRYSYLVAGGCIANEVARAVLGFGVYYAGWVTTNPRALMSFLSLRTHDPAAKFVSYPQAEIEECARSCEKVLAEGWPLTYAAFIKNGRVAP